MATGDKHLVDFPSGEETYIINPGEEKGVYVQPGYMLEGFNNWRNGSLRILEAYGTDSAGRLGICIVINEGAGPQEIHLIKAVKA